MCLNCWGEYCGSMMMFGLPGVMGDNESRMQSVAKEADGADVEEFCEQRQSVFIPKSLRHALSDFWNLIATFFLICVALDSMLLPDRLKQRPTCVIFESNRLAFCFSPLSHLQALSPLVSVWSLYSPSFLKLSNMMYVHSGTSQSLDIFGGCGTKAPSVSLSTYRIHSR